MADLFVSYAREDQARVARLVDALAGAGYTVWWDTGLLGGANFAREIQAQIDQARAVLVVWTARATESDWVLAEVQRAHAREKLVCTRVAELPPDRVPLPYNALHHVDAGDPARVIATLRGRAVHPSNPERPWDFYAEPPAARRRAMERFRRVSEAYRQQVGTRPADTPDPSLDVRIEHCTRYRYDRDVRLSDQLLRLHPTLHYTRLRDYRLSLMPAPDEDERFHDLFDNLVRRVVYRGTLRELGFEVSMVINLTPFNPFLYPFSREFARAPFRYAEVERRILAPYLEPEAGGPRLTALAASLDPAGLTHADLLVALMHAVGARVSNWYDPQRVIGEWRPLEDVLASGQATSGEQARLLVALLRRHGLAARHVSGYLLDFIDTEPCPGVDDEWPVFYSAWVQTYVPGGGWVGLDPMTQLLTNELYVPLACGPGLEDTNLVQGTLDEAEVTIDARSWATPVHRGLLAD